MKDKKLLAVPAAALLAVFLLLRRSKAQVPEEGEADIQLSNLRVHPPFGYPGESFVIAVTAQNYGSASGARQIDFEVPSMATVKKTVTLSPGQQADVQATFKPTAPGTYTVYVDGLSSSFTVEEVSEPNIVLSGLEVSPSVCYPGEEVTISVVATNMGNAPGSREIVFEVS